jgi:hypothetical protein
MKIVKAGRWLYDGTVERPVDIVGLDFDFWFELARADGQLDEGEEPKSPGDAGLLYYVRFRSAGEESIPTWVDSQAFTTIAAAIAEAETKTPTPVVWT